MSDQGHSTDFLYPFLEAQETDAVGLLADLAASARSKAAESARLQEESLAEWDAEMLGALAKEVDLSSLWTGDELQALLVGQNGHEMSEDPGPQLDKAEELRKKWGVETGQLWQLGDHRLLCGDSTKREDVERVMGGEKLQLVWTDPPYGVSYGAKNKFLNAISPGNRIQTPIENDQLTEEQTEDLCRKALLLACEFGLLGAALYVACPAGTQLPHFIAAVASSGFQFKHSLVWVKNQFVLGRCDYHYKHEIILYGWKEGAHFWNGDHSQDSVFLVDKPHVSDLHPTTKPVELVEPMIRNSSKEGDVVYDPFLGSGTTMVASHRLGRRCFGIEIDPGYCGVVLERMSGLGLTPTLITHAA